MKAELKVEDIQVDEWLECVDPDYHGRLTKSQLYRADSATSTIWQTGEMAGYVVNIHGIGGMLLRRFRRPNPVRGDIWTHSDFGDIIVLGVSQAEVEIRSLRLGSEGSCELGGSYWRSCRLKTPSPTRTGAESERSVGAARPGTPAEYAPGQVWNYYLREWRYVVFEGPRGELCYGVSDGSDGPLGGGPGSHDRYLGHIDDLADPWLDQWRDRVNRSAPPPPSPPPAPVRATAERSRCYRGHVAYVGLEVVDCSYCREIEAVKYRPRGRRVLVASHKYHGEECFSVYDRRFATKDAAIAYIRESELARRNELVAKIDERGRRGV